jgi:hypothetical protein
MSKIQAGFSLWDQGKFWAFHCPFEGVPRSSALSPEIHPGLHQENHHFQDL